MGFVDGGVPAMKVSMIGERYCDQGRHVAENCNAFGFVVVILEDARREHIQGTSLFALTTRVLSWLSMQAVSSGGWETDKNILTFHSIYTK